MILLGAAECSLTSCRTVHLEHDAPGNINVSEKPVEVEPGQRVRPDDPGEEYLNLRLGPYVLGGEGGEPVDGLAEVGLEGSISYRSSGHSHFDEWEPFVGHSEFGANIGWTLNQWGDGQSDSEIGKIYLEGQYRFEYPVAAVGYAVEPDTGRNGLQMTFSPLGMNWLRYNYFSDGAFALLAGFTIKVQYLLVWSH